MDLPTIRWRMTECLSQFNDMSYDSKYEQWRSCGPIHDFAECIQERLDAGCDLKHLKAGLFTDKEAILQQLRMHPQNMKLTEALERYDFDKCEDEGEEIPCSNDDQINDAIVTCTMNVDIPPFVVNGNPGDNYGITADMCGTYFSILSCSAKELRESGANCDYNDHHIGNAAFQFVRDSIQNGYLLPHNNTPLIDICNDYMPVCSAPYISWAYYYTCYNPFFHEKWDRYVPFSDVLTDNCSSAVAKDAFLEFVVCVRLNAVAREVNDCTAQKVFDIINDDPLKFNLFHKDTDLPQCIGKGRIASFDSNIQDRDTVCQSSEALWYFTHACNRPTDCSTDIQTDGLDLKCGLYYSIIGCVEMSTSKMTFNCSVDEIQAMNQTGYSLELLPDEKEHCELMDTFEFRECQYPMYKYKEHFRHCYSALHNLIEYPENTADKCSVFYTSLNCMKEAISFLPDVHCYPDTIDDSVREVMLDLLNIDAVTEAKMNCSTWNSSVSYSDMFSGCTGR